MRTSKLSMLVLLAAGVAAALPNGTVAARPQNLERPGTAIGYRAEHLAEPGWHLEGQFTASQLAILEYLNRADRAHLSRLATLVIPLTWHDDVLRYSPFSLRFPAAADLPTLLVVDQASQAFAAYERGTLVRWGPVSSGRRSSPTPSGTFRLNWRSRGRYSTVDPTWYMEWYFNFHNTAGLALHEYALPGRPASHACVRLLKRDAHWLFDWGEAADSRLEGSGTPVIVVGYYDFEAPPPWRSLEHLARGIDLPELTREHRAR